ncbi:DUF3775 domain-containing protein [Parasphingopyxis algicola]|uniref:DUF3775 domain-containing protein n=1 Tax=Parasphingopyxis algicola TaxID=2026624 RepID=UPI0015A31731|nr:DUF3775 domain-containing protein [Parasphingopyxis algicola]QLC24084.1 DUF3775 domain-containing protein [Parasphingopyxis algicola]
MELETPLDMICRIIVRAREWDAQVPSNEPDEVDEDGPVSTDDEYDVMIDEKNDSVEAEIEAALDDLAEDQIAEVLALAWVGNGTFEATDWDEALAAAADPDSDPAADQLMEMPMLAAYLDAGLEAFGLSCEGIGQID